ncbi:hypothetical protein PAPPERLAPAPP_02500 [Brevundimonas phage vB_BpoS-Papperlapapp]|uniref:Uncharacterized protein n=2 Tax=Marchewkavirus TaxID=3425052 RepID=A0A9E7MNY2_9CAUD|nr:hypothetical protein KABACHOK_00870 [Brevundimonas phage vB_BpoS-Kabachok]USN14620.1 hypothetical protein DOMOVOI_01460 [Brevundimonas phage vB_BpoS-Domovoi]USN15991.1 hypothetical protein PAPPERLAPAPP_02500 [Brevundimonas phage vB_BpoS-Papperlapapp]
MSTLTVRLQDLTTRIATECKAIRTLMNGNAASNSALLTTAKSNLLAAINELHTRLASAEGALGGKATIDDELSSLTTTFSSSKISNLISAKPSINDSAASATTVYSSSKTVTLIDAKAAINDATGSSATETYSIDKIKAEIAAAVGAVDAGEVINDALSSSTTRTYSIDKIKSELSATAIAVKDEILGGAGAAYDTLKELQDLLIAADGDLTAFNTALANRVRTDINNQNLTALQKQNARTNIDAYGSQELGDPDTDLVAVFVAALV